MASESGSFESGSSASGSSESGSSESGSSRCLLLYLRPGVFLRICIALLAYVKLVLQSEYK